MPAFSQSGQNLAATAAEQRLLGDDGEAQANDLLPFTRSLSARGTVAGSLMDAATAAGVPRSAMPDALRALDAATGGRAPQDGDTFYVRWEQTYAIQGHPIGVGRVQWLELRTAGGLATSLHRFRPRTGGEQFFQASGEAATPPAVALPIEQLVVTSPFGVRPDPMGRAPAFRLPQPAGVGGPLPHERRQLAASIARAAAATVASQAPAFAGFAPRLFMHEGVDFAVPQGTPIYAASDGVVAGARPNGGYGNWIRIDHADGVATVYGHLSRFAAGLKPGNKVVRGELIAFSGNTGRSTGPHLHFEVLNEGKPVDPLAHAAIAQLAGIDFDRFSRQVAARERERDNEVASSRSPL